MQLFFTNEAQVKLRAAEERLRPTLARAREDAMFLAELWAIKGWRGSPWRGADVAIVARRPDRKPGSFYPEPLHVVTPHWAVLSGAFVAVREAARDVTDLKNKYELYAALGEAANAYHREHGPGTAEGIAGAVLEAALRVFGKWRFRGVDFQPLGR